MNSNMPPKKQKRFDNEIRKPRIRYKSELSYNWLPDLLDAFKISDAGVVIELESQSKKANCRPIACKKGCFACCLNPTVPINQIELQGISWYMGEILDDETYSKITPQLLNHAETTTCCFLLDGACSIYPVRPIACRAFYVYGDPCKAFEDVSKTRPEDIPHLYNPDIAWMVSRKLMPHMGIPERKQIELFNNGFMMKQTRDLHTFDWNAFKTRTDDVRKILNGKSLT